MKRLLFFSALLGSVQMHSQVSFNRAMHDNNEIASVAPLVLNNHLYFITESRDAQSGATRYLYKFDGNGNQVFKKSTLGHVTAGIVSMDNNLVYVAQDIFCGDVIIDKKHQIYIAKVDASGNIIQSASDSTHMFVAPTAVVQLADSSYRMFTDSAMYIYDKALQFISKSSIGYSMIRSAIPDNGNMLLLSQGFNNTSTLVVATPAGSVAGTTSLPVSLNKILPAGSAGFVGLGGDGKLYKYNSNKVLTQTSAFNYFVSDLCIKNDSIYCITYGNAQGYAVADINFNSLHSSLVTTTNYSQHGLDNFGSKIAIMGRGKATNSSFGIPHCFSTITVKDKMTATAFTEDIKLLSIGVDSSYSSYYAQSNYAGIYVRPMMTIKNTGATTISNFKVNMYLNPSMSCGLYVFQDNITNISLAPGATISVAGKKFANKGVPVPNGPSPLPLFETFCFYTTLPNGEPDKTFEDNEICQSFGFIITGLNKNAPGVNDLSIFPNPAQTEINVRSEVPVMEVQIYNQLGMLVKSEHPKNRDCTIEISGLLHGIYFVNCLTESGTRIKKIVKN